MGNTFAVTPQPPRDELGADVTLPVEDARGSRLLAQCSLAYLALPVAIFLGTWLNPWIGWPALLLLGVLIARCRRLGAGTAAENTAPKPQLWRRIMPGLILAVLVAISGVGGLGYQDFDWQKHNAMLHDLVSGSWPVHYAVWGGCWLNYYIAYYLPAAVVGRLLGWTAANVALVVWTLAGFLIAWHWVRRLSGAGMLLSLAVFVGFSGLDMVGQIAKGTQCVIPLHLEWWAAFAQYSSNMTLMFWVPQHAIPGWILTSLLLYWHREDKPVSFAPCIAMAVVWSPFVAMGLLPLWGWHAAYRWRAGTRPTITAEFVGGCVLAAPLAGFFAMRYPPPISPAALGGSGGGFSLTHPSSLLVFGAFFFLEVGAYVMLVGERLLHRRGTRNGGEELALLIVATVVLLLLPRFCYGYSNDLTMRASIPSLLVIQLLLLRGLKREWSAAKGNRESVAFVRIVAVLLLIGAAVPVGEVTRHLMEIRRQGYQWQPDLAKVLPAPQCHPDFPYMGLYFVCRDKGVLQSVLMPRQ